MWRKIVIDNGGDMESLKYDLESMCRHVVDRSQGCLVEIEIWYFGTNDLIEYIAGRFSLSPCNSKSLELYFFSSFLFLFQSLYGVMLVLGFRTDIENWGNYC
ncbi:unnamed protein product [Arabidopsis halleri]